MCKSIDDATPDEWSRAVFPSIRPSAEPQREFTGQFAKAISHDPINHPAHYASGEIECIDYMRDVLTPEEFRGYLRGQVIKYQHRLMLKGTPALDAGKLAWYAEQLRQVLAAE